MTDRPRCIHNTVCKLLDIDRDCNNVPCKRDDCEQYLPTQTPAAERTQLLKDLRFDIINETLPASHEAVILKHTVLAIIDKHAAGGAPLAQQQTLSGGQV